MIESIIELAKQMSPLRHGEPTLKVKQRKDGLWDAEVECGNGVTYAKGYSTQQEALAALRNELVDFNKSQLQQIKDVLKKHASDHLKLVSSSPKESA